MNHTKNSRFLKPIMLKVKKMMMSCAKVGTISNLRPEHIHYVNISSANTFNLYTLSLQDGDTVGIDNGHFVSGPVFDLEVSSQPLVGGLIIPQQHWNWSCDHFGTELKLFCIFLPLSYTLAASRDNFDLDFHAHATVV